MPVTATLLTNGGDGTDTTSYATASVSPSGNKLIIAAIQTVKAVTTAAPTLSGNGLTWVEIVTLPYVTGNADRRLTLFRAMGAAPSTGAITISTEASNLAAHWAIIEFGNVDTTGANGSGAVVQSASQSEAVSTTVTVTLAAFGHASNATFGAFGGSATSHTWTVGTGFTELSDAGTDLASLQTEWQTGNDTTVDATSSALGAGLGGVAIEIKFAGGGGGSGVAPGLRGLSVFRSKGRRYFAGWKPDRTGLFVPAQARERLVRAA